MDTFISQTKTWITTHLRQKESYTKREIRPTHDWHVILSVFFISIFLCSLMSLYVYNSAQSGILFVSGAIEENRPVSINDSLLSKIITTIDADQQNVLRIYQNTTYRTDPSL